MTREVKKTEFELEGSKFLVISVQKHNNPAEVLATLHGPGFDVSIDADSHADGIGLLSDFMKSLGDKLAKEAYFEESITTVNYLGGVVSG